MNIYVSDEVNRIAQILQKEIKDDKGSREYVVFANKSSISQYLACVAIILSQKVDRVKASVVIVDKEAEDFIKTYSPISNFIDRELQVNEYVENVNYFTDYKKYFEEKTSFNVDNAYIFNVLDSIEGNLKKDEVIDYTKQVASLIERCKNAVLVQMERIPQIKHFSDEMTSISEREYEVYVNNLADNDKEKLILDVEEIIRKLAKDGSSAFLTRFQNVFGPGVESDIVQPIIDNINSSNKVIVDSSGYNKYMGMNYIRYVICNTIRVLRQGDKGNIYHIEQYRMNEYKISSTAYELYASYGVELDTKLSDNKNLNYSLLCNKKITPIAIKANMENFNNALYKSVLYGTDKEYIDENLLWKYDGKLDIIRKLEIDMMKEIKRICEKHNIKYFLVGGSLLGAIRHKGFIPWDDDLDIGMLRADYKKFQKVAPGELDPKYSYQSYRTEKESHYIFDKVRLKDTYFATRFSNRFKMENGIFIDILVYDKTAKTKLFQKLQIRALTMWTRVINVRWVNVARRKIWYHLTKVVLPIMRLFPLSFYHKVFEMILQGYNWTNNKYLIDGVGQNIRLGAFPKEWFEELIEVPFEDMMLPVPKMYDDYLRFWYGDRYMEILSHSFRNSGHAMNRIDLGRYMDMTDNQQDLYYKASQNGELYDTYE